MFIYKSFFDFLWGLLNGNVVRGARFNFFELMLYIVFKDWCSGWVFEFNIKLARKYVVRNLKYLRSVIRFSQHCKRFIWIYKIERMQIPRVLGWHQHLQVDVGYRLVVHLRFFNLAYNLIVSRGIDAIVFFHMWGPICRYFEDHFAHVALILSRLALMQADIVLGHPLLSVLTVAQKVASYVD